MMHASGRPAPLQPAAPSVGAAGAEPGARAWLALAILCFVYVLNFLDRQLLSILAKPIQDDLGVTDGQLGLISGLYFALFYCLLAIPVGWLADRTNRVRVLSLACALWSAATVACGLVVDLPAAGGCTDVGRRSARRAAFRRPTPSSPTTSRPGMRGTALSLFNLGPPIGQALGVAFGASIAAAYSWRSAFVSLGRGGHRRGAGRLVVRARAGARRTRCGRVRPSAARQLQSAGLLADVPQFFSDPVLLRVSLACGATQFVTYAVLNFTTLFLMREKGMTLERGRDLLRAAHRHFGLRRDVRLRAPHRSLRAALEDGLRLPARGWAGARHSVLRRVRVGAAVAAGAGVPRGADLPELLLSLAGRHARAGGSAAASSACWPARCCCW